MPGGRLVSENWSGVDPTVGGESQAMLGSEAAQSHQTAGGHEALLESSQECCPVVGVEIPTPGALQQGIDSLQQL